MFDFVQQEKVKFSMEHPYMLPIVYCQHYDCWCPGDLRSQIMNRHGFDHGYRYIPSLASETPFLNIFLGIVLIFVKEPVSCFESHADFTETPFKYERDIQ